MENYISFICEAPPEDKTVLNYRIDTIVHSPPRKKLYYQANNLYVYLNFLFAKLTALKFSSFANACGKYHSHILRMRPKGRHKIRH